MAAVVAALPSASISSVHAESLGTWTSTSDFPLGGDFYGFGLIMTCVTYGGYIYCLGGPNDRSPNVYYASLSSSGISSWISTTPYPISIGGEYTLSTPCAIDSGYMYCVGGDTGGQGEYAVNATYYAPVSSSGVGTWTKTTDYPVAVAGGQCVISRGYIYCIGGTTYDLDTPTSGGGHAVNSSYYAPISSSGIGAWTKTTSYPTKIQNQACVASSGYVYCVAGSDGTYTPGGYVGAGCACYTPTSAVYYATLSSGGIGQWIRVADYPDPVTSLACAILADSNVYCVGGFIASGKGRSTASVNFAPASPSGMGPWTSGTNYPVTVTEMGCVISGGYIYCVNAENQTYYSPILNPGMSTTSTSTTSTSTTTSSTVSTTTASGVVLSNVQSTSGTASSSPYEVALPAFNVGTGTNLLLLVGVSANSNNVLSVTFGGAQLTQAVSSFNNNDAEFWYLVNPSGTGGIVVTLGGPTSAVVGAYAFSGVSQSSPIPTTAAGYGTAPSSPSVSITTQHPNSWVLDLPSIYGGVFLSSASCTQQWDVNVPNAITGGSSSTIAASPGQFTCRWTASPGGDLWDDVAIEVMAAG